MKPYPHHYHVAAAAGPEGEVLLSSNGLESLRTAPPAEFDGPGDRWSPETLLVGAIADCFTLSFRAVARAARLPWVCLHVEVAGTLERDHDASRFTRFVVHARLQMRADGDLEVATRALHRAEAGCLISNSLSGQRHLVVDIEILDPVHA